jgi:hypothetical protein
MTEQCQSCAQKRQIPFLATPNGLITLLVVAMIAPVVIPITGVIVSLTVPWMVIAIGWMRPELGRRWFYLAAIPIVLYGSLAGTFLFIR